MATRITVALEDDLDGGPAEERVRFGPAGTGYEIDLSKKNARAFRGQLAPCLDHARRAGRGRRRRPARAAAGRQRGGGIRAWAKGQGLVVSARGRIPAGVIQRYQAATKDPDARPVHGRCEPSRPASLRAPDGQPTVRRQASPSARTCR